MFPRTWSVPFLRAVGSAVAGRACSVGSAVAAVAGRACARWSSCESAAGADAGARGW